MTLDEHLRTHFYKWAIGVVVVIWASVLLRTQWWPQYQEIRPFTYKTIAEIQQDKPDPQLGALLSQAMSDGKIRSKEATPIIEYIIDRDGEYTITSLDQRPTLADAKTLLTDVLGVN